jgi:hypothetical protein
MRFAIASLADLPYASPGETLQMPENSTNSFFDGKERLEIFPVLGRAIRKGSPAELRVSDAARVRDAIRAGNFDTARGYLSIIRQNCEGMIAIYCELCLAFASIVAKAAPQYSHRLLTERAYSYWKQRIDCDEEIRNDPSASLLLDRFAPHRVSSESVVSYRQDAAASKQTIATEIIDQPSRHLDALLDATEKNDHEAALLAFENYYREMRSAHDLLVEYCSATITAMTEICGQAESERMLQEAFTTCLFYEGLWGAIKAMNVEEAAAFLADHLRAHFSGDHREGSVDVVEEADRYRLIFAPCGSGGAMRQGKDGIRSVGAKPMPTASRTTWQRAGEVPGYCTHCAMNQIESVRRLGWPLMITEFDPDPFKPCGWTIYKDPAGVPESRFAEIGAIRDAARFERLKKS